MPEIIWLIILAVCLISEIATLGLVTIWFAGGALVAFFVALVTDSLLIQMIVFFAVSLLLLFFTRPIAARFYNNKRTKTNVESLVGEYCKVTEEIDNFNGTGTVFLNGLEWTARSKSEEVIPLDTRVKVCAVDGVKVIVEKAENEGSAG
ncbi:MAG: NfeD family protein [Lachnospiraceae bacterium]|nr:NfeD family protein [Lachnospiraceae bacterium]